MLGNRITLNNAEEESENYGCRLFAWIISRMVV